MIEKTAGCNHMTCKVCRHEFCWLCGGNYSSSHFSGVLGCTQHGGTRGRALLVGATVRPRCLGSLICATLALWFARLLGAGIPQFVWTYDVVVRVFYTCALVCAQWLTVSAIFRFVSRHVASAFWTHVLTAFPAIIVGMSPAALVSLPLMGYALPDHHILWILCIVLSAQAWVHAGTDAWHAFSPFRCCGRGAIGVWMIAPLVFVAIVVFGADLVDRTFPIARAMDISAANITSGNISALGFDALQEKEKVWQSNLMASLAAARDFGAGCHDKASWETMLTKIETDIEKISSGFDHEMQNIRGRVGKALAQRADAVPRFSWAIVKRDAIWIWDCLKRLLIFALVFLGLVFHAVFCHFSNYTPGSAGAAASSNRFTRPPNSINWYNTSAREYFGRFGFASVKALAFGYLVCVSTLSDSPGDFSFVVGVAARTFIGAYCFHLLAWFRGHIISLAALFCAYHTLGIRRLVMSGWPLQLLPLVLGGALAGVLFRRETATPARGARASPHKEKIEEVFAAVGGVSVGLLVWMEPTLGSIGVEIALAILSPAAACMIVNWILACVV